MLKPASLVLGGDEQQETWEDFTRQFCHWNTRR